jgi:UDP-N-acetylglucosamine 2-epimerase
LRLGERPDAILGIGCPSSDIAREFDRTLTSQIVNSSGSGSPIDVAKPYVLVLFHPTTTEFGGERAQMEQILLALDELNSQTILLWPNIDAGADHISKAIRVFRDRKRTNLLRTLTNLSPENYLKVLCNAACAIGNSSSFVRDASFFGTPVVLVGNRQEGRETDQHVVWVVPSADEIIAATLHQLSQGRYAPSSLYGDGLVSERIADRLVQLTPYSQKRLHYIYDALPLMSSALWISFASTIISFVPVPLNRWSGHIVHEREYSIETLKAVVGRAFSVEKVIGWQNGAMTPDDERGDGTFLLARKKTCN